MENTKSPMGFFDLFKDSIIFAVKNIHRYILLALIILVPAFVIGGVIGGFGVAHFIQSALGQGFEGVNVPITTGYDPMEMSFSVANLGKNLAMLIGGGTIFMIIAIIYGAYFKLNMVSLTVALKNKLPVEYGTILKWSFKHLLSYIMLGIRVFFYVAWIPAAISIVYIIIQLIKMGTVGMYINYLFGLLGLLSVFWMIYRGIKVTLAKFPFAEEGLTSKEALHVSVGLSDGHWWKIFGYLFGYGILIAIIISVIVGGLTQIEPTLGVIANLIFSIILTPAAMIFQYGLYKKLRAA